MSAKQTGKVIKAQNTQQIVDVQSSCKLKMEELKTDCNLLCHACLSSDRQMSSLGENFEMFSTLIGNNKQCLDYNTNDIKLCWECVAKFKRFKMFQMQVKKAQDVLVQYFYGLIPLPESLTKLAMKTKSLYDCEMKHEDTSKKGKTKTAKLYMIKKALEDIDIKIEAPPEIENKAEIVYTDENVLNDNDNAETLYANDAKSDIDIEPQDNDFGDDTGFISDFKMESVKAEENVSQVSRKNKKVNIAKLGNFSKVYTQYATLVETKQIDWGDIQSYFTTLYFDEKEMEQYIFARERNYTDHRRYQFNCATCKLGYKRSLDLKRHNNLNHRKPGAPFKCSYCNKTVHTQTELESHWREHTPIAKCNLCGLVLRQRGMKQHLNGAHTKQYACRYCRLLFETISSFGAHYRDVHMKFTCDYCNKNFKSKSRLAYHIRNIHVPAFCEECNRPYRNRCLYVKHCILMHPQLTKRHEVPSEDCFCVECDKQYRSLAQYRKHLKVSTKHVEVKRQTTPCPECGKVFARKLYMKNHYNLYHLKKTKFYCESCDKYFARAFGLRVHNTHVHQKVQRVRDKICDLCGRAFSNNRTMLNHRRTHTGERPHKCPYCTAEFIQKYAMQTHMRTQHKHFT